MSFTGLRIVLDGDGALEGADAPTAVGTISAIGRLVGGMESGRSSVFVTVSDGKGNVIFAETSLRLFLAAADAFRAAEIEREAAAASKPEVKS